MRTFIVAAACFERHLTCRAIEDINVVQVVDVGGHEPSLGLECDEPSVSADVSGPGRARRAIGVALCDGNERLRAASGEAYCSEGCGQEHCGRRGHHQILMSTARRSPIPSPREDR
jgi:hypothetical protein